MHLWRKLLSLAVTILFAMLILSFSTLALAWTYEEAYHTSEDLPRQVASLLPAEETMLYGYRNGDTAYIMLSIHDKHRVRIFRRMNESWKEDAVSSLLPSWHDIEPSIGVSGENVLYLQYTESNYASIARNEDGLWKLGLLYHSQSMEYDGYVSFYPQGMRIYREERNSNRPFITWLYGKPLFSYSFENLDIFSLLENRDDIFDLIDTTGWAVVNDTNHADIQRLFIEPDENSSVLCQLFEGAPVQILEKQNDWVQVDVVGIIGWVPITAVQIGRDMLSIQRKLSELVISGGMVTAKTVLYTAPSTASQVVCNLSEPSAPRYDSFSVIGIINDDWYLVISPNGIGGCMEAKWFYEGNG